MRWLRRRSQRKGLEILEGPFVQLREEPLQWTVVEIWLQRLHTAKTPNQPCGLTSQFSQDLTRGVIWNKSIFKLKTFKVGKEDGSGWKRNLKLWRK